MLLNTDTTFIIITIFTLFSFCSISIYCLSCYTFLITSQVWWPPAAALPSDPSYGYWRKFMQNQQLPQKHCEIGHIHHFKWLSWWRANHASMSSPRLSLVPHLFYIATYYICSVSVSVTSVVMVRGFRRKKKKT